MIPPARYVPRCEQLEDRLVPALTIRQVGTTMRIIGDDNLNDFIQISDAGTSTPRSVVVVANGQFRFSNLPVTRIIVRTGAGNDTITYQMQRQLAAGNLRNIQVDVGDGHDTVTMNLAGTFFSGSSMRISARLGSGFDTFNLNAPSFAVQANSVLSVDTFGGGGTDQTNINFVTRVDGAVFIRARGEDDHDRFELNGGTAAGSTGLLSVRVEGGQGLDVVTPNLQEGSVFDPVRLNLIVDGGSDFDVCTLAQGQGVIPINCESTPQR
jgi:hypothetical protein